MLTTDKLNELCAKYNLAPFSPVDSPQGFAFKATALMEKLIEALNGYENQPQTRRRNAPKDTDKSAH